MVPEDVAGIGANVRSCRETLGLSIRELARRSNLSATAIWKIETGRMVPSVLVLFKIARALDRKVTELIDPVVADADVVYTPQELRRQARRGRTRLERISASSRGWVIQAAECSLEIGAKGAKELLTHRGEEFVYCLEGRVEYTVNGRVYELNAGDALHFKSHLPHSLKNIHNGISRVLSAAVPPREHVD